MSGFRRGSMLYAWFMWAADRLRQSLETAHSVRVVNRTTHSLNRAIEASRLGAAGRTVSQWTRNSWLYRWLTAEPEPDVIVIDLRETWTVGPIVTVLESIGTRLGGYWATAASRDVLARATGPLRRAVRGSRIVEGLAVLFEPPEPPQPHEDETAGEE
ncbi:MAG: hypothetical protein V5A21_11470 [Halapricum sp.]